VPPLSALKEAPERSGRTVRCVVSAPGRMHVELPLLEGVEASALSSELEAALGPMDGFRWAEALPDRRIVVAFDEARVDRDEVLDAIEAFARERAPGGTEPRRRDPLADQDAIIRTAIAIGADVVALAISLTGRVLRAAPLPFGTDITMVLGLLDSAPRFRRLVEERLGAANADLALSATSSIAQGLNQGALGPMVDLGYRSLQLDALVARRRSWERRGPDLEAAPEAPAPTVDHAPRPLPLPAGAIERYADTAWYASLGAAGLNLAVWRNPHRVATSLSAGLPKAARLGREAFAARLQRTLADRGVIAMHHDPVHLFDRIDCVVFGEDVVTTGELEPGVPVRLAEIDEGELRRRLLTLFSPEHPERVRRHDGWSLGALEALPVRRPPSVHRRARSLGRAGRPVLGLLHEDRLVALVPTQPALAPGALDVLEWAARAGLRVAIATDEADIAERLGGVLTVGADLRMAVRSLQLEGNVVALVTGQRSAALAHADISIGVHRPGRPVPWDADVICGADPGDLVLLLTSFAAARRASSESVRIAAVGSIAAGLIAFAPPPIGTGRRVMTAVNVASLVAIVNAARIGIDLGRRPPPIFRDEVPWHALDVDEALLALGSSSSGLTHAEATDRFRPWRAELHPLLRVGKLVLEELANPLTPLLVAGAMLSMASGSFADGVLIASVIGIQTTLGTVQRLRAERAIASLDRTSGQPVRVLRGGEEQLIEARALVPGDIVRLGAGETVPADCRIVEANGLEVDESNLTGESLPVAKHHRPCFASAIAERTSMLYADTSIAAGSATAAVVATAEATEAMRALAATDQAAPPTGVEVHLRSLTRRMIPISLGAGAIVAGTGLLRGRGAARMLATGVSLTVAAVPEGLPLMATAAQTATVRRLSARGVLVRNPRAVEALGRVEVLCADKTGTLTEGRITLRAISDGEEEHGPAELPPHHRRILGAALRATPEDASRHPTDEAIEAGAAEAGVGREEACPGWRMHDELPFEPARGYHAVVGAGKDRFLVSVKGAPEIVIPRCTSWARTSGAIPLDEVHRGALLREVDRLAHRGMRVLAVAERAASRRTKLDDQRVDELAFLGLIGLADPVRTTALEAVDGLRRAGLRVVMITGDHPSTAGGIAAEIGILDAGEIVTGPELDAMDDGELDARLQEFTVFARVTPSHKVRIVQAYQRAGRVVAMTGDGANDAPAIRLADVGIALGDRSTPAARTAADVVVLNDRIESIVEAVLEGRAMWVSVRDAIALLLGGNLGEIAFTVAGSLAPGPPPLDARQLLLMNLLTDALPATMIAVRPPRDITPDALLREGPDRSLGPALQRAILWRASTTAVGAGLAYLIARLTGLPARARTVAFVALTASQLGQTLLASRRDPAVIAAVLGCGAALALAVQTPGVSHLLGCRPLGPIDWATALGAAGLSTVASSLLLARVDPLFRGAGERRAEARLEPWGADVLPEGTAVAAG